MLRYYNRSSLSKGAKWMVDNGHYISELELPYLIICWARMRNSMPNIAGLLSLIWMDFWNCKQCLIENFFWNVLSQSKFIFVFRVIVLERFTHENSIEINVVVSCVILENHSSANLRPFRLNNINKKKP